MESCPSVGQSRRGSRYDRGKRRSRRGGWGGLHNIKRLIGGSRNGFHAVLGYAELRYGRIFWKIGNSLVVDTMKGGYSFLAATSSRVNNACGVVEVTTEQ